MIIRKATLNDAESITTCLLLAMEEIVYSFIGTRNREEAKAFMFHFVTTAINQYSWQNCWVAEDDGIVVAAVTVYNGARLNELRQPIIEHIKNRFNRLLQPEDETQAGEFYIDSLGVSPGHQGKGTGSKLLQFVIDEYVHKQRQTVGLLVDENNPHAKRLYQRLGFTVMGKKTLLGKTMEHLQMKG